MKKQIMALSALALSVTGGLNLAHAQDGTVTFNGTITSDSCTIATDSKDITVDFGQVSQFILGVDWSAADTIKKFNINLNNCPVSITSATIAMAGKGDNTYLDGFKDGVPVATLWHIKMDGGNEYSFDGVQTNTAVLHEGDNTIGHTATLRPVMGCSGIDCVPFLDPATYTGEATYTISYQ